MGIKALDHFETNYGSHSHRIDLVQSLLKMNENHYVEIVHHYRPIRQHGERPSDKDFSRFTIGLRYSLKSCELSMESIKHNVKGHSRRTEHGFALDKRQLLKLIANLQVIADKMEDAL